jgi:MFS superfamily sulfate permease-like transporter
MEQNANPWKANLTNGLIMGLFGIVYSLVMYFLDLSFNKLQGWIFFLIQIVILYFMVKSYRDNYKYGMITFGQALGSGVIIFLYYAVIMAIFTYILYAIIDPDLMDKQLAFAEEQMLKRGMPEASVEAGMKFNQKIMKPAIMAPFTIFNSMFVGVIMSLIVAAFVRKEGNPLVDPTEK